MTDSKPSCQVNVGGYRRPQSCGKRAKFTIIGDDWTIAGRADQMTVCLCGTHHNVWKRRGAVIIAIQNDPARFWEWRTVRVIAPLDLSEA